MAPISISIASLDDSIVDVNPQFTKFLGYSKEEVIGKSFSDFTHEDEEAESLTLHNEMIAGKIDHFSMEKRYLKKDGNWVWGHSVAVILRESGETPDRVLAMQQDINDLKLAESELRSKESFLRSITDNLTEGVLVIEKDGYLKYINRTAQEFTSLESIDLPLNEWASAFGIFSSDQITPIDLHDRPVLKALAGETVIGMPVYVKQTASGIGTHILLDAVPLHDKNGEVESALTLFRDISDRKKQEKEILFANTQLETQAEYLVELNKELEQYAYYAAHDIKGPVNNISSLLDMLREEDGVKEEGLPLVDKIEQSINDMKRIINALNEVLDMRKGLDIRVENASISKTVDQVLTALSEIIRSNGVHVTNEIKSEDDIHITSTHLHSILQNLVLNAIKYRDPAKEAWVKMETLNEDGNTIIRVSDNGLGFDQGNVGDRVFDVFKRYHDHVPGKGIGLYLVKSIVESYQGTIEVVSKLEVGSTFVITIPEE